MSKYIFVTNLFEYSNIWIYSSHSATNRLYPTLALPKDFLLWCILGRILSPVVQCVRRVQGVQCVQGDWRVNSSSIHRHRATPRRAQGPFLGMETSVHYFYSALNHKVWDYWWLLWLCLTASSGLIWDAASSSSLHSSSPGTVSEHHWGAVASVCWDAADLLCCTAALLWTALLCFALHCTLRQAVVPSKKAAWPIPFLGWLITIWKQHWSNHGFHFPGRAVASLVKPFRKYVISSPTNAPWESGETDRVEIWEC